MPTTRGLFSFASFRQGHYESRSVDITVNVFGFVMCLSLRHIIFFSACFSLFTLSFTLRAKQGRAQGADILGFRRNM